MYFDPPLIEARLLKRYKRFLADIILSDDNRKTTVYCPNTGSMKNCQPPNAKIWCSVSDNPKRKYPITWELIETPAIDVDHETGHYGEDIIKNHIIGINTHRANQLVAEAFEKNIIKELQEYRTVLQEIKYGKSSRIDFLLRNEGKPDCYVEVKSVTLSSDSGVGLFPDAVTQRGTRHLKELINMVAQGSRAALLFCVQHTGINCVKPAKSIDPVYAETLKEAVMHGVEVLAYNAALSPTEIVLKNKLPVDIFS